MRIVGRKREQVIIQDCLESPRPEFLVVYGRRRVGKTYLIREFFHNRFSFYASGVPREKTKKQLKYFQESLKEYGTEESKIPADWTEAFSRLRKLLESEKVTRDPFSGKRVVFLDELPWMDTARSDFKTALDYFWNTWGSAQPDLLLIVCGSATSWIITHLLNDRGGFYNRVTRRIHLVPFSLQECELLMQENQTNVSRRQILMGYMVFGGIPFYLNLLDSRLSMDQNVEELVFKEQGDLRYEYERLFDSLFRNAEKHMAVIRALSGRQGGLTRTELAAMPEIGDGEPLTKTLSELTECGFIRKYSHFSKPKQGSLFQIVDPFILFCLRFPPEKMKGSWLSMIHTPEYYAWRGLAFETLCLNHVDQIKGILGIQGVQSQEYSWRSRQSDPGAQIDLMINRRDDVINLCEMKFTTEPFSITPEFERQMIHKMETFRKETGSRKAIHLTLISAEGISAGGNRGSVTQIITGDDLFRT
jgi:hypothetical protein